MNIKIQKTQIRTIKQHDPRFTIKDGFVVTPRAAFEIDSQCPSAYKMVITECIQNGWLAPVANMTERELLFVGLTDDQ